MNKEIYKIGKNILENLTIGMYTDSKFIYREYIQNAADAIDEAIEKGIINKEEAKILINIDCDNRNISIEDNATGICKDDVSILLGNIADSIKDKDINKGFRGIGRLGGLAYCQKLTFETSSINENIKTIMEWDADKLHKILNNPSDKSDAATVIDKIVKINSKEEDANKHYFKVTLNNIKSSNNDLLNQKLISTYLQQVAPLDFNSTIFALSGKIYEKIKNTNQELDTYKIYLNNDRLYKIYQTGLLDTQRSRYDEIGDIEYKEFYNKKNELLAWSWVGISKFEKCIPEKNNPQRGVRLKKANIQLGDSNTLNKLHKESRGNGYFIGEVHAVHNNLIPNARRDYFNECDTLSELENQLKNYFCELYNLYHLANDQKNALKKQNEYIQHRFKYENKVKIGFIDDAEQKKIFEQLEISKRNADKAKKVSEKISEKAKNNSSLKSVVTQIKKEYENDINNIPEIPINQNTTKKKHRTDTLNKLNRDQRKLISKVYQILSKILDPDTTEDVINAIEKEFS